MTTTTDVLLELTAHRVLSRDGARNALIELATGAFNSSQVSAFLTTFMMRSMSISELQGFREAMLELCIPVSFDQPVMDVCGTGGDGKHTFNISTLSAFVVAATGQPVAKHGNYGVSSVSGSSNVLEYLGVKFHEDEDALRTCLDKANICFIHAPKFHPAMKHVAPIRKELGIRTFFNMLGPMVNPARPPKQLIGVFGLELARQYGYLYQDTGTSFTILHDTGGYDEVSLTGPVKVFSNDGETLLESVDFNLKPVSPETLRGGSTIAESASIFMNVLEGRGTDAQQSVVAANAALALHTANLCSSIPDAVKLSLETIRSGKALATFKTLLKYAS